MTNDTKKSGTEKMTRGLKIEGMKGDGDVTKVRTALTGIQGVQTKEVKIGSASIESDQNGMTAACKAVTGAGFKTHEHTEPKSNTGHKPAVKS